MQKTALKLMQGSQKKFLSDLRKYNPSEAALTLNSHVPGWRNLQLPSGVAFGTTFCTGLDDRARHLASSGEPRWTILLPAQVDGDANRLISIQDGGDADEIT